MATHSSILAWRIPMDVAGEEHGRLQSTESDTAEQLSTAQHRFTLFRPVTFATTHPMVSYLKRVLIKKPSPLFSPFYLDVGGLGCGGGEGPASTHGGGRGTGTRAPSGDRRKKTGPRGRAPRNTSAGSHHQIRAPHPLSFFSHFIFLFLFYNILEKFMLFVVQSLSRVWFFAIPWTAA